MPVFAATYRYADDPPRLDQHRPRHRAFLADLHRDGILHLSGPLQSPAGGLLILTGDSPRDVEETLDADPFHQEGLIAEREIREWTVVIGRL